MELPREPGLQRRLAYGDIIRARNERQRIANIERYAENLTRVLNDYESLMRLPIVKLGVTLQNLIDNTCLHVCFEERVCVICQDETRPLLDVVRRLNCTHEFHASCIDKWLVENKKCPLCNKLI